jgi:DNA-binding transcriptional MerR regulator
MKIGKLSRRTGVSVRMLRYYEAEGLLSPPRTDAGYRDYGVAEEESVGCIEHLRAAGMTLGTIRKLLPCVTSNDPEFVPCDELRRILAEQVDILEQRIDGLARSRTILTGFLAKIREATPL